MVSKILRRAVSLSAILIASSIMVFAQTGTIEGTVKIKNADGTMTPVPGAQVDVYRTDIKGHWDMKTDKSGHYVRLGLPVQGTFIVTASGPGMQPTFITDARITQGAIDLVGNPGDGAKITYEEVQKTLSQEGQGAPSTATPQNKAAAEAAQKEYEAKAKESKEMQAAFDQAVARYNHGLELMNTNDYSGAVSEFEAASAVDPGKHAAFTELAYKAHANAAEAHYQLAVPLFNQRKRDEAKPHFEKAIEEINKAISIASSSPKPGPNLNNELINYYNIWLKNAKLLVEFYQQTDAVDQAVTAIDKARALDTANSAKWNVAKGDLYRTAYRSDDAIKTYKEVLATDPGNIDALYGLGLTLFATGNEANYQEAANYLSDFASKAPANDSRAATVKESLDALKKAANVEPEKGSKRRRKP